ncbi:hypothetical protein DIPPA_20109 [Diplonema papillatum]|nr:hypothetical protein DIPPA_20109 [Diplonema papillatum]
MPSRRVRRCTVHQAVGCFALMTSLLLASAISDGRSLVVLKPHSLLLGAGGTATAAREAFGSSRYGVGGFQDTNGWRWAEKEHYLQVHGCAEHVRLGQAIKACLLASVACSSAVVVASLFATSRKRICRHLGVVSLVLNVVLCILTVAPDIIVWQLYTESYPCAAFELRLRDVFTVNYAWPTLLTAPVLPCISTALLLITNNRSDEYPVVSLTRSRWSAR